MKGLERFSGYRGQKPEYTLAVGGYDDEPPKLVLSGSIPDEGAAKFVLGYRLMVGHRLVMSYLRIELQLSAVQQSGCAILYIDRPSEEIKLAAVKQNGYAIQYIDNPSEEIQLNVLKKNHLMIKYILNPTKLALKFIEKTTKMLNLQYRSWKTKGF